MLGFGKKKDVATLISEGLGLLQAGQPDKAIGKLTEATEADPRHAQAWYVLGTIHAGAGRPQQAVDCYAKSAEHAPPDKKALPLFNLANTLQATGKLDDALKMFTLATQADPMMADAWINRGRLLDDAGKHLEAIASYNTALALAPDDPMALGNRGNSLRALNRFAEAKANYEASLAIEPNPGLQIGLGACLSNLGQPDQGLRLIDDALKKRPLPPGLVERAIVLASLKRYDEALASIDDAIRQGLRDVAAYHNRGEILAKLGNVDESIQSFDQALKLDPQYTPALFGKARVMCNAKMFADAKAAVDLYFLYSDGTDGLGEAAKAVVVLCHNAGVK